MTKTTIRELTKRYHLILKKCLLINMGLLLISTTTRAESINTPLTLTGVEKTYNSSLEIENGADIKLSDDAALLSVDDITISGGDITLTNAILAHKDGGEPTRSLNISGGNIYMKSDNNSYETILGAIGEAGEANPLENPAQGSNVFMTGGTLTVDGGMSDTDLGSNVLLGKYISLSGGELNIHSGAMLKTSETFSDPVSENDIASHLVLGEKSTITLTQNGIINLAGSLKANIDGDSSGGTLKILDSNAVLDGDIQHVNFEINADYSLSGVSGNLDGLNIVANNDLLLDKDVSSSNLTAQNNGTLTLAQDIVAINTNLENGGTLNLGTNKLTTESLTVAEGGTVAFQVSGKENYGRVMANNYNVASENTNLILTLDTGVLEKDDTGTFVIFANQSGEAQKVDFKNLSENSRYVFQQNEDGTYTITGTATAEDVASDVGGDKNMQNTVSAWLDQSNMPDNSRAEVVQEHLNRLSQTDPVSFKKATEALMPEVSSLGHSLANSINNKLSNLVKQRFSGAPSRRGMSGGDTFTNSSVWAQGLYNKSKLDTTNGFDGKTHGIAMGIDGEVLDDLKIGIGYAYTESDVDSTGRSTDIDTHTALVYGEYTTGQNFVNAVVTYGRSAYDEDKDVSGLGVRADYDMDAIYGQVIGGRHYKAGDMDIAPEAGIRYLWTKTHGYTDTAGQYVKPNTADTLTGLLGFRIGSHTTLTGLQGVIFNPEVSVHATYDMLNDKNKSIVQLANGASYTVQGDSLDRFGVEFGAKLGMMMGNTELSLDYEGRFKKDYTDHTGLVNLKYHF